MRVVYLHQYFTTPAMPGGTRSYEMARRLVEAGHEVEMITSTRQPTDGKRLFSWDETNEDGIKVHWVYVPYLESMGFRQRTMSFLKFAVAATLRATSLRADVIFATSTPLTIAIPGILSARRLKAPFVFEVRDLWPELPIAIGALRNPILVRLARTLERWAYRNATRVVALSPGMKEGVTKAGYPCHQISMIPNACDVDLFQPSAAGAEEFRASYDWLEDRPLVVYTGKMGQMNGVGYFVKLACAVHTLDPGVRFLVVGRGNQEREIRDLASKLGVLNRNFFMMPRVPKLEMPNILAAADVVTSLFIDLKEMWANSANKFFDALASGTPVAINYGGWQAELIETEGVGLVLDPNDIESSARTLVSHIRDREWKQQAGANARRLAESRFSRDVLAADLECVLYEAIQSAKQSSEPE